MNAVREIGLSRALRFFLSTLFLVVYGVLLFPPLRVLALRLAGARVGRDCVIHGSRFFNAYRRGFAGLVMGDKCFIGDDCLLDLADRREMQDQVTLAERVTILTHTNVGYADHPLQPYFPAFTKPVVLKRGAFIGVNATILPGVTVGEGTFVAAGSVLIADTPPWSLVAGVPARVLRDVRETPSRD
jgi:acetyltransferase-like isoleucine patch superfamily enzyme